MIWIIENVNSSQLLILFLAPIAGWLLHLFFPKEKRIYVATLFGVLLLPSLTGYDFIWGGMYEFCVMMILAILWAWLLTRIKSKWAKAILSIIIAGILFAVFFMLLMISDFAGSRSVHQSWKNKDYQVKLIKSQGFSGRPLMVYELYHLPVFGLFNKKIESMADHPSFPIEGCLLEFKTTKVQFDKCKEEIILVE